MQSSISSIRPVPVKLSVITALVSVCLLLSGTLFWMSCLTPAAKQAGELPSSSVHMKAEETTPDSSMTTTSSDPLHAVIKKLDNGLTVYLTEYHDEPRVQGYIAVRTGSRNDPRSFTGLAHYFEHLMFKGTDKMGSLDYSKEKPILDEIRELYDKRSASTDEKERKALFEKIDKLSTEAAQYVIPNEFDKMLSVLGARGTNAYTSYDKTVYMANVPANRLEQWLTIEAERFRNPVMRLFHTELETVYEEKNMSLDRDRSRQFDTLMKALFPVHPYGTPIIGLPEHLKNPSVRKVEQYYRKHYVPSNMAICLSGDFDAQQVLQMIERTWGKLPAEPVPPKVEYKEQPITAPIVKSITGPDRESVLIGFRFPGINSPESDMLTLVDMILNNRQAGLIDLNLNQAQKVLSAGSYPQQLNDYSTHVLFGVPRQGQSLEDVKNLLLEQIEKVKKGEFPEWLIQATINDLRLEWIRGLEYNSGRAHAFVTAFTSHQDWKHYLSQFDRLEKINKSQLVDFARSFYGDNYVVVYKRQGKKPEADRIAKPPITPLKINRDAKSSFFKEVMAMSTHELKPKFLDFQRDMKKVSFKDKIPLYYIRNKENELFRLTFLYDFGTDHNLYLKPALQYLDYLGTEKLSPAKVKEEFYKLGCTMDTYVSNDQIYLTLSGLIRNLPEALALFEELLTNCQANEEAIAPLKADILKKRRDAKLNKEQIFWAAGRSYARYGKNSSFTHVLSDVEINKLSSQRLIESIKRLREYAHRIFFYGPKELAELTALLKEKHKTPHILRDAPDRVVREVLTAQQNEIYFVNYEMKQSWLLMYSRSFPFSLEYMPVISLFNQYYGEDMSSVVFQEMREAKALAYGVWGGISIPRYNNDPFVISGYIATQSDKLPEAIQGMLDLFNVIPRSDKAMDAAKQAIVRKIRSERFTKSDIFFRFLYLRRLGLTEDYHKTVYEALPKLNFDEIKSFFDTYIANRKFRFVIMGNKDNIDFEALKKVGTVHEISLEELFGY